MVMVWYGVSLNTPWLVLCHNPLYPGMHLCDPSVDPGVLLLGAPDAPGDDTDLFAGSVPTLEQRTSRIATAGVLLVVGRTEHVRSDPTRGAATVAVVAPLVCPNPHVNLHH